MASFIAWYFVITLLGLLTFPLAYRLFPALADRGYTLARALGLLIWGYVFWLAASLGIAQNDTGGVLLALCILLALSIWAYRRSITEKTSEVVDWLKANKRLIIVTEIVFFAAFAFMAFVRASNPAAVGTEKPMELAFINAILRSPTFPPRDPWLSGYAISYYYFGYVMAAMLARITGTIGNVAFNLMNALVFSLSAIGAYGLVYNLLAVYRKQHASREEASANGKPSIHSLPLFGPLFLLLVSNLEGFLEYLYARGLFWKTNLDGIKVSPFWSWLDILDLRDVPWTTAGWITNRHWWWFRASRVISDIDLAGGYHEIIDEFPAFSFVLSDLHPHVLAMPFGLLAVAVALNLFLGGWKGEIKLFGLSLPLRADGFFLSVLVLGGLGFLNTWDILAYTALVLGAFVLMRTRERGWSWRRLEEVFGLAIPLGILSLLLYFPFYIGFSSQLGGVGANLVYPTRGAHLWVMMGSLLIPIFAYLVYNRRAEKVKVNWLQGMGISVGLSVVLWGLSWLLGIFSMSRTGTLTNYITMQGATSLGNFFMKALLNRFDTIASWITFVILLGFVFAFLAKEVKDSGPDIEDKPVVSEADAKQASTIPEEGFASEKASAGPRNTPAGIFVLLLLLVGGLLLLGVEYFYLRDFFGSRINTIFKFYFQAWMLFSLAAAFGTALMVEKIKAWRPSFMVLWLAFFLALAIPAEKIADPNMAITIRILEGVLALGLIAFTIVRNRSSLKGFGFHTGLAVLLVMALIYPIFGFLTNTSNFRLTNFKTNLDVFRLNKNWDQIGKAFSVWTLDSGEHLNTDFPTDAVAIQWLNSAPDGVIVEAVGGDYNEYGHISVYTGLPTLLGWPGHEEQWRGGWDAYLSQVTDVNCEQSNPWRTRQDDVRCIYEKPDWTTTEALLEFYQVRYVYIGTLERLKYTINEEKFRLFLKPVFEYGNVIIYEVP